MLTKRKDYMASRDVIVKKLARSSLAMLVLCTASIAPAAFAFDSPLVERTVTVKFKLSELESEGGTDVIYAKIRKKATSYCRADSSSLHYLGASKRACVEDLMDQFIESANIDKLKAVHLSRTSTAPVETYALN